MTQAFGGVPGADAVERLRILSLEGGGLCFVDFVCKSFFVAVRTFFTFLHIFTSCYKTITLHF